MLTNSLFGYIIDYVLFGEHPEVDEPAVLQPGTPQAQLQVRERDVSLVNQAQAAPSGGRRPPGDPH